VAAGDIYHAYVDSSGDTGFNFRKGSSPCYVVAVFLSKTTDDTYNQGLLLDIKRILHVKPLDEVKYSTLRRHKRSAEAHALLSRAKGTLLYFVALKRKMNPVDFESSILHSFPVGKIPTIIGDASIGNIFIDNLKKTEEFYISILTKSEAAPTLENGTIRIGDKVVFEDSKRAKLLQLADFFAGAMRYFFERYEERKHLLPCFMCRRRKNLCRHVVKHEPLEFRREISQISPLIYRADPDRILFKGLFLEPVELCNNFHFLNCKLKK
jgi:hypothetical protein